MSRKAWEGCGSRLQGQMSSYTPRSPFEDAFDSNDREMLQSEKANMEERHKEVSALASHIATLRRKLPKTSTGKRGSGPSSSSQNTSSRAPASALRQAVKGAAATSQHHEWGQKAPQGFGFLVDDFSKRFRVHRGNWSMSRSWQLHGVEAAAKQCLHAAWDMAVSLGLEPANAKPKL